MKRYLLVVGVIVGSAVIFAFLVIYGWMYRYGAPGGASPKPAPVLQVSLRADEMTLKPEGLDAPVWSETPAVELNLLHQVTETPWPVGLTPSVRVQAFHNDKEIYFRLEWADDQADTEVNSGRFADACAVALPTQAGAPAQSIMMGFTSRVNVWHWRADADAAFWGGAQSGERAYVDHYNPFEEKEVFPVTRPPVESAVGDLLAEGPGSLTRKTRQLAAGRGLWKDGRWRVIIKRVLVTDDAAQDVQIEPGERGASFAVWDGDQGDRGARKSISDWVLLRIEGKAGPPVAKPAASAPAEGSSTTAPVPTPGGWSFSLISAAYGAPAPTTEAEPLPEPRVITIHAKRFQYDPYRITLQRGERVTFRLVSLDVTHGLYLDGYGIQLKARPGLMDKATFTADKTGRFSFRCSETCGEFHPYMIGYLTVEPNSRFHIFVAVTVVLALGFIGVTVWASKRKA